MKSGGGVPAHFINYRIKDAKIREKLSTIKWWQFEEDKRKIYIDKYHINLDEIINEKMITNKN